MIFGRWQCCFYPNSQPGILAPGRNGTCHNYPIGFTAWAETPTIDLKTLRLVLTLDPLGAPGIKNHDFVAVLGTESTPGLQERHVLNGGGTHDGYTRILYTQCVLNLNLCINIRWYIGTTTATD